MSPTAANCPPPHQVERDGQVYYFAWEEGQVLLDALLAAGVPAPYSCQAGECGACQCVVAGGASTLKQNHVLDEWDLADGVRLACQCLRTEPGPYEISYLF